MPPMPKKTERAKVLEDYLHWRSPCGRVVVYKGDCREVMRLMPAKSIPSLVSDPPYGLEFMGKEWDAPWKESGGFDPRDKTKLPESQRRFVAASVTYGLSDAQGFQTWFNTCAKEMERVLKPGAHSLTFGGTRMFHRIACAVEDAGFDVRDVIIWAYGRGFPKSHDVSKAIDRMYGVERDVVGKKTAGMGSGDTFGMLQSEGKNGNAAKIVNITAPATAEAQEWSGFGSALKPCLEPVIVARKLLDGTLAQNTLAHGCGGINVDACRVGTTGADVTKITPRMVSNGGGRYEIHSAPKGTVVSEGGEEFTTKDGRWPGNLLTDGSDEVKAMFPTSSSSSIMSKLPLRPGDSCPGEDKGTKDCEPTLRGYDDSGSAARFFKECKYTDDDVVDVLKGQRIYYSAKAGNDRGDHNTHATVKPVQLMAYLVRLVTKRGATVLDPFMGSGTTGVAAVMEGCQFIGIEQSEEYCGIAVGRIRRKMIELGLMPEDKPQAKRVNIGGVKMT